MWFFEQMLCYADTAGRLELSQGITITIISGCGLLMGVVHD